ncbi:four helix bundle protein [Gracilimonas halophila]|jgi:four helix bundle protein|uniref:Four helix bundle protein n=1 Tax=Gracilimonas halophila TaxID=1834464 RepID=A0ABW5JHI8_9BACT
MNKYKNLEIWQRSVALATEVYSATKSFPKEEKYGITSQIRRCSVSVPSNIAEGAGRGSKKEFKRFLNIAYGSIYELETQLLISRNLDYLNEQTHKKLSEEIDQIQKMIYSFSKKL